MPGSDDVAGDRQLSLTPDLLLDAYEVGLFPMAEARDSAELRWFTPRHRGVFPLDRFHISRSLRRRILHSPFEVRIDHDFAGTITACADRPETWINDTLFNVYLDLHHRGQAHSVEVWDDADLVGGVFGVTLGAAFFGESMFSRRTDTSKIALAYLVHRLRAGGYTLFDTQFITQHLSSLGAVQIPAETYRVRLQAAVRRHADFYAQGRVPAPSEVVTQRTGHTS